MYIRVLFFCVFAVFSALAQAPGGLVAPSPSENELNSALEMADAEANPQALEIGRPHSAWRAFGSLVFVLGLAGGGVWALRKWGIKRLPGSGGTRMKVEETLALGERRYVSILRVDDEKFLIAAHPQGVNLLARMDGGAEPGFGQALDQQVNIQAPIPIRDMEARLRGDQR